jgi:hypothetical protein
MDTLKALAKDPRNIKIVMTVLVAIILAIATQTWEFGLIGGIIALLFAVSGRGKPEPTTQELVASGVLSLKTDPERVKILRDFVVGRVANGYRVELQDDFSAVLLYGKRPNHILHLLLSIVTLGFWLIIWILIAMTSKESRTLYKIDEYGVVDQS